MLAYLMLDGPGIPQDQLRLCVFVPTAITALAWGMIRWKKWLAAPALLIAVLGAFFVSADALHSSTRVSMIEDFGVSYVVAIALAAGSPLFAIGALYLEAKKRANQPLQRNASTGSASSLESPARRG